MNMIFYTVAFILLLGPLVFIHEFGHYLFAKLFNVRVDTFSMGFGPKLLRRRWGETEYCVSAVPLGGYVKLYGQDPSEQVTAELRHRALQNQDAWKRFLIFLAGPLFNFLFAIFVFALMLVIGEPHVAPIAERVVPGTQAYVAGFRSGDVITTVDRKVVSKFEEVAQAISEAPNREVKFRIKRKGAFQEIKAVPRPTPGYSIYGEAVDVGEIEGLQSTGRYTVVGVSNPSLPAAKAGLKTGDEIVTFNGIRIKSFEDLLVAVEEARASGAKEYVLGIAPHEISFWMPENKPEPAAAASLEVRLPARALEELGLHSSELFVLSAIKDSPAEKSGVAPGDRILSLNRHDIRSFSQLKEGVQEAGESTGTFQLTVERAGKRITKAIVPTSAETRDPIGRASKQFMMGVYPLFVQSEPEMFIERIFNPFTLTVEAWSRSLDLSAKTLLSIKKLFFREVSMGTLGGPILIGKLAGDSMARGIAQFLKVMALISISLAIFNILPVPILDGGHIFLLLVEVIRGKPISMRSNEMVQQIGLTLIVFLLVVVLFNDISRVGLPAIRQIFQ